MLSKTLGDYKNKYQSRLSDHMDDYEDNTPKSFLEIESKCYSKYYKALTSIKKHFKKYTIDEIENLHIYSGIVKELKKIDENIYFDIVTELKKDGDEVDFSKLSEEELMKDLILIDFKKLNNYIISAKSILDFIYEKPEDLQNSGVPEKPKDKDKFETDRDKNEEPTDIGENDYTKSTIEDCLFNIKNHINPDQYEKLVDALYLYFTTGKFPNLKDRIRFKRVNKKKVGWALKEAYFNLKTKKLSIDYFRFAKENINLFSKEEIDPTNFKTSRFYKYFTTNPDK